MRTLNERATNITSILHGRGIDANVSHQRVFKNNATRDGLSIQPADSTVAPTIYPDADMLALTDEQIADYIEHIISAKRPKEANIEHYLSRRYILDHVRPRLISATDENLAGVVASGFHYHLWPELNMVITYDIALENFDVEGQAYIQLTDALIIKAEIDYDELHALAIKHIESDTEIHSMRDIIAKISGVPEDMVDDIIPTDSCSMWVISTRDKHYGAAVLLSPRTLELIIDTLGTDNFYILPSSVHEVIVLPADKLITSSDLISMVREVNATQVAPEEQLDTAVYAYTNGLLTRVA